MLVFIFEFLWDKNLNKKNIYEKVPLNIKGPFVTLYDFYVILYFMEKLCLNFG